MKSRSIFIAYQKRQPVKAETVITVVTGIISALVIFASGFIFSWFLLEKPLNDEEFAFCEGIAQNLYSNEQQLITNVQQGVCITINDNVITVSLSDFTRRGKIIAQLRDGNFVMTRNFETANAIVVSILVGLTTLLIFSTIYVSIFVPITPHDSE